MKKKAASRGFTIMETLIGLFIFLGIFIPLLRYAGDFTNSGAMKDRQIAYALLRGECCVMYKNQIVPPPSRFITIDHRVYEISFASDKDSILVDWTMAVKKAGKPIASLHGLLYTPAERSKNVP